jgi:hypothetical protein
MEVSGQFHTLATSPLAKNPSSHWARGLVEKRKIPCTGMNSDHPACRVVAILTELFWIPVTTFGCVTVSYCNGRNVNLKCLKTLLGTTYRPTRDEERTGVFCTVRNLEIYTDDLTL